MTLGLGPYSEAAGNGKNPMSAPPRSLLPDYYCLLPRTEMAGATKGIDKHLLRCDIGRGRKSFSVSRCDVRGGDDVTRTAV